MPLRARALACLAAVAAAALRPEGPRRLAGAAEDKSGLVCSEQDALYVVGQSAIALANKFVSVMDDLDFMLHFVLSANGRAGVRDLVLSADMCCCDTVDWRRLGRSSPWAGYHDCSENRTNELWYGNVSLDGGHGMFANGRTLDTDLAFVGASYDIFPGILKRQRTESDRFYVAAWIRTTGEVVSYYPGFNQLWPGHSLGDALGGTYDAGEQDFVQVTLPENNPGRTAAWTSPYSDPAGQGLVISAAAPVYFSGAFRGHQFSDEYVAAMGIEVNVSHLVGASLRPTPSALSMVIDDDGRLIAAPDSTLAVIFGTAGLKRAKACVGQGAAARAMQSACNISNSSTGDWADMVRIIRNASRGSRESYEPLAITREGVSAPHLLVFYRWQGRNPPLWNTAVLLPRSELQHMGHWQLPQSISASLGDVQGTSSVSFSLVNDGIVNLTYRITRMPPWLTIVAPAGTAAGLDCPVLLAAGQAVEYTVQMDASRALSSQNSSMIWLMTDAGYPDCFVETEAVVEVSLLVPAAKDRVFLPWSISLGAVMACILAGICACYLYKWRRKWNRLQKERWEQEEEQVNTAVTLMESMAFPIHLLALSEFCGLEALVPYETLRGQSKLKVVDVMKDLIKVRYIFLSHQWTAWHHPDHSLCQFPVMRAALLELARELALDVERSFAWVDYCCIPQRHADMQKLAILSLPLYAAHASAFLIVAPEVRHSDTGELCDLSSYMTRMWCRAEQMSHVACRGFQQVYCACSTSHGVTPGDKDMIKKALHVFDGSLTCCRLKHRGATKCDREHIAVPLLGLYANMLRSDTMHTTTSSSGRKHSFDAFKELAADIQAAGRVFPRTFQFQTEGGVEERELFGDLLERVRQRMSSLEGVKPPLDDDDAPGVDLGREMPPLADELGLNNVN